MALVREAAGNDIDAIFGVAINEKLGDSIIVTVIATGFDKEEEEEEEIPAASAFTQPVSYQVQECRQRKSRGIRNWKKMTVKVFHPFSPVVNHHDILLY